MNVKVSNSTVSVARQPKQMFCLLTCAYRTALMDTRCKLFVDYLLLAYLRLGIEYGSLQVYQNT